MEDRRRDLYDDAEIDRILLRGGTILGTSRVSPFGEGKGTALVKETMAKHEIDHYLANELEVVDGRLTGRILGPIVDASVKASMLRDLEAGLPVEAAHIVGDMLARAGKAGIAAPLLQARAVETVLGALCGMVVIYFWRNSEERRADTQAMPRIIAASQADRRGGPADADLDGAAAGEDDDGHSAPSQDRSR